MTARPRGHADGVPPVIRRMWSLLYRATRRASVRCDQLTRRVDDLDERVRRLEEEADGE